MTIYRGTKMSKALNIREFAQRDESAVLYLNQASVNFLSPLDKAQLRRLHERSEIFWVIEQEKKVAGFLIGFTDGSEYDSPNYQWFTRRLKRFLYIDRVVVGAEFRRMGIGKEIYLALHQWLKKNDLACLAAEIDSRPPNRTSLDFHQKQGFVELAQHTPSCANKTVSLQVKFIMT